MKKNKKLKIIKKYKKIIDNGRNKKYKYNG